MLSLYALCAEIIIVYMHELLVDSQIPQTLSPVSCSCLDYVLWTVLNIQLLIMAIIVSRYQQLWWCIICHPQLFSLQIWCQRFCVPEAFSIKVWKFHVDGLFGYQTKYFCVAVFCVVLVSRIKSPNKLLNRKITCFSTVSHSMTKIYLFFKGMWGICPGMWQRPSSWSCLARLDPARAVKW